ncbi:MAG: hypothetical protein KDD45_17315, partial [Bdellovibrionales bacterium]|nr:hypothetical protein [Bdellovibrionales bacterium]
MKLKKKSFLVILLVSFWVGYSLLSLTQIIYTTANYKKNINDLQNKNIDFIFETSTDYILSENFESLEAQMKEATKRNFFNYYCFMKGNKKIFEYYPNADVAICETLSKGHFDKSKANYKT